MARERRRVSGFIESAYLFTVILLHSSTGDSFKDALIKVMRSTECPAFTIAWHLPVLLMLRLAAFGGSRTRPA